MNICPQCQKSTKVRERITTEKKTKKKWFITFCAVCGYNYEIDEWKDKGISPKEEMEKYKLPPPRNPWV